MTSQGARSLLKSGASKKKKEGKKELFLISGEFVVGLLLENSLSGAFFISFFLEYGAFKALFEEVLLLQIFSQQNCSAAIDPADEDGKKCNKCNPPVLPFFPFFLSFFSGSKHAIKSAALFSPPRLRQQRVPEQRRRRAWQRRHNSEGEKREVFFFSSFFFSLTGLLFEREGGKRKDLSENGRLEKLEMWANSDATVCVCRGGGGGRVVVKKKIWRKGEKKSILFDTVSDLNIWLCVG